MSNGAIEANSHPYPGHGVNGETSAIGITVRGSNWYWVGLLSPIIRRVADGPRLSPPS